LEWNVRYADLANPITAQPQLLNAKFMNKIQDPMRITVPRLAAA
jgi:hypothetical protein